MPVRQRRPHNLLMSYIGRAASEIAKAKTGTLKGGVSRFIAQGLRKAVEGRLAGNPGRTDAKPIQCACGALLIKTLHPVSTSQTRASRVRHQSRSLYRGVTWHRPVRRGSARRAAASAQGKAFPTRIVVTQELYRNQNSIQQGSASEGLVQPSCKYPTGEGPSL